jgi:hypothetical protein
VKAVAAIALAVSLAAPARAQAPVPAANSSDVRSIDSILAALYSVISGPAGDRDWARFRSLFAPDARLTSVTKATPDHPARLMSAGDYASHAGGYFKTHAFYESALVNRVDRFGNAAQVFSSYESRNAPGEKPFARGVNSIQLFHDKERWWILSVLWDEETATNPLPANLATHPNAAAPK